MNEHDILTEEDIKISTPESNDWIVRLDRRDVECQFRFIDKHGNINSRLSSSMRMSKNVARQLASAISEQHKKYKAKALLYRSVVKNRQDSKNYSHSPA